MLAVWLGGQSHSRYSDRAASERVPPCHMSDPDKLREAPNDTSDELEPQLVLAVCEACEAMGLA